MQLLQAISMLLLGSTIGILCTLFDVAFVGSAAFATRFAAWALFNVLVGTHVRNRWRAVWWSIPLNLGLVESYILSTSFSFENISRKLIFPFAPLALVAPLLVAVAWTAHHERRNLFGRLLGVLFAVVVLVVSSVIAHGITVGNVVCTLLCLLFMFFIPTHTLAFVELDDEDHVVRVEGEGVAHHEPRERLNAHRQMRQRQVRRESKERRTRQHVERRAQGVRAAQSTNLASRGKQRARLSQQPSRSKRAATNVRRAPKQSSQRVEKYASRPSMHSEGPRPYRETERVVRGVQATNRPHKRTETSRGVSSRSSAGRNRKVQESQRSRATRTGYSNSSRQHPTRNVPSAHAGHRPETHPRTQRPHPRRRS